MPLQGVPCWPPHPRSLCPCRLGGNTPQSSPWSAPSVEGRRCLGLMWPGRTFQRGLCGAWWGGRGPIRILCCPETCQGIEQTEKQFGGHPGVPALSSLPLLCPPSPGSSCCRFLCFSIPHFSGMTGRGASRLAGRPLCGHAARGPGQSQARRLVPPCPALSIPTLD